VNAHARAVAAVTSDAGSSTDARLSLLRARQVFFQVAFLLIALSILFIAVGLSRRQLRASEEMRRVQELAAQQRAQFFANMSHELRTPLVAIRGFASMISIEPLAGAAAQEHAEQIEAQAQELLGIINNILDSAKLEAGRVELEIEDVDVAEVVDRCVQRCLGLVGDKALELTGDVPVGLRARADFVKLQQVLTNLIGNAVKFTAQGSVRVRARAGEGAVEIEVVDSGIGIEPAVLEQIWEPFHQGSGSVNRQFGGTGLGLSIVRGLVERMGGQVRVRSTPGQGSTFTVSLPEATPAAPPTSAADARALERAS
jgi:signal transduction histidine kinase